jgi:spore germination protein
MTKEANPEPLSLVRLETEPAFEKSIQGSHRGFIHSLPANIETLRGRLNTGRLKFVKIQLEGLTNNTIAVAYLEGYAQPELLESLLNKIHSLQGENITGTGQIEQLIKDYPYSPFPQYQTTERLDKAIQALFNGQLLILLDGTPAVLIGPVNFFSFLEAPEDLQVNWIYYTLIRMIRLMAFIAAILLPAYYVSIVSFHYYVIPLNFIMPLIESRIRVPFPPLIEALIMAVILEMIYELLTRITSRIGTGLSIIALLLIGVAIASTGFIGSFILFIGGVVNISLLILPLYDLGFTMRILRFFALIFAAVFGMLGLAVYSSLIFVHLLSLQSLGQPYFQPLIPLDIKKLAAFFIRPVMRAQTKPKHSQRGDQ